MKRLIIIFNITIAFIASGQNLNVKSQFQNIKNSNAPNKELIMNVNNNTDTVWIYKKMEYYNWEGQEYVPFLYEVMEYNNNLFPDKPSKGASIDPTTGDTTARMFYFYDSSGLEIENIYQEKDSTGEIWKNIYKQLIYYNNDNIDTCRIKQGWDSDSNIWVNNERYIKDYDTNGYQTLYVRENWDNNKWHRYYGYNFHFDDKECMDTAFWYEWIPDVVGHWQKHLIKIWHYDECGVIYEYVYKKWDMSSQSWINYQKFTDIEHINWTGCHNYNFSFSEDEKPEFKTFTFYHWMGDYWEPIKRTVNSTADSLGGFHYETQEWNEGEWKDIFIVDRVVNEDGFIIFNKVQVNQDFLGVWKIIFADTVVLEYDGPRLTKYEVMWLDTTGGVQKWVPGQKYLYKDYFYVLNTDEIFKEKTQQNFKIIPNPSNNSIDLKLNDKADKIKEVKVYGITGQLMIDKKFNMQKQKLNINVSYLTKGIYIIDIITKHGKSLKGKFIKN